MEKNPVVILDNSSIDSTPTVELLTLPEVAKLLRISLSGARRLQQERKIPFIKVGGSVRIAKADIVAYLAKQRVESIDQ